MKLFAFSTSAENRQRKRSTSLISSERKGNSTLICPLKSFSVVLSKIEGVPASSGLTVGPDGLMFCHRLGLGLGPGPG